MLRELDKDKRGEDAVAATLAGGVSASRRCRREAVYVLARASRPDDALAKLGALDGGTAVRTGPRQTLRAILLQLKALSVVAENRYAINLRRARAR